MRVVFLAALVVFLMAGAAYAVKTYVIDRPWAWGDGVNLAGFGPRGAGGCGPGGCGIGNGAPGQAVGRGGCCGAPGAANPATVEAVKNQVRALYAQTYGDPSVDIDVRDFGCHQEASVSKDGKLLRKYQISGGQMTEI